MIRKTDDRDIVHLVNSVPLEAPMLRQDCSDCYA
jgi:hypothetical protein